MYIKGRTLTLCCWQHICFELQFGILERRSPGSKDKHGIIIPIETYEKLYKSPCLIGLSQINERVWTHAYTHRFQYSLYSLMYSAYVMIVRMRMQIECKLLTE